MLDAFAAIQLTAADGSLKIYVSLAQLVAIRPTIKDADYHGIAKSWIDLTSGHSLAVKETPDQIIDIIKKSPAAKEEQTA